MTIGRFGRDVKKYACRVRIHRPPRGGVLVVMVMVMMVLATVAVVVVAPTVEVALEDERCDESSENAKGWNENDARRAASVALWVVFTRDVGERGEDDGEEASGGEGFCERCGGAAGSKRGAFRERQENKREHCAGDGDCSA